MRVPRTITLLLLSVLALSAQAAAPSYLIVESQTGYIFLDQGGHDKRQVGSLTKIATACVTLDWAEKKGGDLNQLAAIMQSDFAGEEKNEIGWQPGDSATIRDLLYAALVQSDNIAANALARTVGQTLSSTVGVNATPTAIFVGQMNALAKSLGMQRTRFANPTGYDQHERPMPFSTAEDLARLTRYAMNKASFRFYVSQREREIAIQSGGKTVHYTLHTTNDLLGTNGIDGVKTGQTARAGECLILSANREAEVVKGENSATIYPKHLIIVVLGSNDRFGDGQRLVQQGWQLYDQWAATGRPVDPRKTL
ncbi:MAG: D-alanyl-D-alanine carboxypeptidase [Verrucomicrobia bacterium]|nr:D-alanyl-D-alanine carboxypeptidase [Verrucomicrobiota bacterium]